MLIEFETESILNVKKYKSWHVKIQFVSISLRPSEIAYNSINKPIIFSHINFYISSNL